MKKILLNVGLGVGCLCVLPFSTFGFKKLEGTALCNDLHDAVKNGQIGRIKELIKRGADLDKKNIYGWSPLHTAVFTAHGKVVKLLITAGADKNVTDKYGWTALHSAALNGHSEIAKLLLLAGADKNACDKYGYTPLHIAIYSNRETIVKMLLEKRASLESKSKCGYTSLHVASTKGYPAIVALLLDARANLETTDIDGRTSLHWATLNGHSAVVETLLAANADRDPRDTSGITPLHEAAKKGYEEIVGLLIKAGAGIQVEYEDAWGATPLMRSLTTALKKPKESAYPVIIRMLLLVGNASLEKVSTLPRRAQELLKTWGFDHRTFRSALEKSSKLLKEHLKVFIHQLESYCRMPMAIAALIGEYHECLDTRMLLFIQAKSLISTDKSRFSKLCDLDAYADHSSFVTTLVDMEVHKPGCVLQ